MRRVKYPYWEWEDYQLGLYDLDGDGQESHAVAVLASDQLLAWMQEAVRQWPKAAAHHLTDDGMNQRAWLGWAACALAKQVPAHRTRAAWWKLTDAQRVTANACADTVIKAYRNAQTLFDFECA